MDSDEKNCEASNRQLFIILPFFISLSQRTGTESGKKSVKLMLFKPKFGIFCTIFHQK